MIVGIYVALAALCLWGAIAWNSVFMLVMSGIWGYMAVMCVLWFIFVKGDEDDDARPAGHP